MEEARQEFDEIELKELLHIFRIHWWIVALIMAVAVSVSAFVSWRVLEPVYRAESTLFVGREAGSQIAGIDLGQFSLEQKLVVDYREIILSRLVAREVIGKLDLDMTVEAFQSRVAVNTLRDSRLFKITFESTSPELARDVTNALSEAIILKAEEIMEVKNVQIIDLAETPVGAVRPNRKMNLAIAGALGLMLGTFLIFLMEYLNHTIKSERDVERHLGLNILGEIPVFEGEERGAQGGSVRKKNR